MISFLIFSWFSTRKLSLQPGGCQVVLEGIFSTMHDAVEEVLPKQVDLVYPFIATLWILSLFPI
ncbi:hypothetical protein LDG_7267 [Legionella drancourtii LLAP12]|uniref:Uncharacterized protein n=1 Tax=Legionella drancourtii LLAP12 TaxID=658187 RepID=G9EPS8_9GAMM|nr:hypothetical protein LDG_7267 [Legionella drancourtii LLAP12]